MALGACGALYARLRGVPAWAAAPALAAFLVEYPFYLVAGFPGIRGRLAGWRLPAFTIAGAALPYLAACAGAEIVRWAALRGALTCYQAGIAVLAQPVSCSAAVAFQWTALGRLAIVAGAVGLWYLVLPDSAVADIGFAVMVGWTLLGRFLAPAYPTPYPHVELSILARLAVFQSAVLALMVGRPAPETGYGFVPSAREWRIGALHFLYFMPVGLALAFGMHAVRFAKPPALWIVGGTLLGYLWVIGLAEEFLFRGVLQALMEQWTRHRQVALAATSVLFGAVHLWFGGFPNWRWALMAGSMGWFCGRARNQAGGIRAAVVTHALTVTAWRAFLARVV